MRVGIFGATGVVGREIIKVLFDRRFPMDSLRLFASPRSAGKKVETPNGDVVIEDANTADFAQLDLAFFAISGSWSKENAHKAIEAGCTVIDNSSAFRYDDNVPLVIPQINRKAMKGAKLIANPNCTTAVAALPLFALHQKYGLKKVIIATYQAASGAGGKGMNELEQQARDFTHGNKLQNKTFQHQLAFNVIPHIDVGQDNNYTREEMKVVWEARKIFNIPNLAISCTCVRVPTLRVHAESIVVETKKPVQLQEVRQLFENTDGLTLKDDLQNNKYPMPLTATHKYDVEVGRIRKNLVFGDHGLEFFVAGDQLLRGAALNAVEIAENVEISKTIRE